MYRLIVETLFGLNLEVDQLRLTPHMPRSWDSFKIHYRFRDTFFHIVVTRLADGSGGREQIFLDGKELEGNTIPLVNDRNEHHVEMRIP
jgi:cellobiose phosphorylase